MIVCRPIGLASVGLALLVGFTAAGHGDDVKSKDNPAMSSVVDDHMGPAAFLWPPDRVWSAKMDNQAPCGSSAAPLNRTKFPLTGGDVSLVAQDDYYDTKISISYSKNPTSNDDFKTLLSGAAIKDLNPGHSCFKIPDAPADVKPGTNATLQIMYTADWDSPSKQQQTFYACADITYVAAADVTAPGPCFNQTEPGEDDKAAASAGAGPEPTGSSSLDGSSGDVGANGSSGSKLSGGAIAGIVIGSVAGVGLIAAGLLFGYRRKQQKKRRERLARMEENARRDGFPMHKYSSSHNEST
ncbi:hypothetical protein HIM_07894 [Hirsutella minnesotensis 3608]|uniref:Copper acquisition factor BIM1-like domain-containing protein n=1 Tax=Hirsutella minnesotensis 3608 TaxID=1043627 RepID=A0A0F7ZYL9_9HYPO|nr:hypothetical protein HIM_07894 [Hirsutella minnesotensis 3608]